MKKKLNLNGLISTESGKPQALDRDLGQNQIPGVIGYKEDVFRVGKYFRLRFIFYRRKLFVNLHDIVERITVLGRFENNEIGRQKT